MKNNRNNIAVVLASIIIILAGMKLAASIVAPFLLACFISIIGAFPLFWMYKKGVKKGLAIFILIASMFILGIFITLVLGATISDFVKAMPEYEAMLKTQFHSATKLLLHLGIEPPKPEVLEYVNPSSAFKTIGKVVSQLGNLLTNIFLISFIAIFMLLESTSLPDKLKYITKDSDVSMEHFKTIGLNIKNYLLIKTYVSLLTGTLVTIALWIMGIDFALLWGTIAFLLNYVPNIGSIIAAFPAALMALVQFGAMEFGIVVLIYVVINVVVGSIIEPKFMGKGLGLSPLIVFLSLVFWGWILGIVGMFLSVPLTMMVKIIFSASKDKQWVSVLLSDGVEESDA